MLGPPPPRQPRKPRPLSCVRSLLGFPPETQAEAEERTIRRTRRLTTFKPPLPKQPPPDLSFMNAFATKTLGRSKPKLSNAKHVPSPLTIVPGGPTTSPNSPSTSNQLGGPPSPSPSLRARSSSFLRRNIIAKKGSSASLSTQCHNDKPSVTDAASVSTISSSPSSEASKRAMESSTSSLRLSWEEQPSQEVKLPRDVPEPQKFKHKNGSDFHPYDALEAPYMQPYNYMAFENDNSTHRLLQKVLPEGSPTFHHYGDAPPSTVLDLGCGQGQWVVQAATTWAGTKVTGLDLVDLVTGKLAIDSAIKENITWVRHNFVKDALPFPDNSFDLVRLAGFNLSLPWVQLPVIFTEIHRVLARNGRLEVVYDEMIFPYVQPSSPVKSTFTDVPPCSKRSDSDKDSDDDQSVGHTPTLSKPKAGSAALATARSPYEDYERFARNSAYLEETFCVMLHEVYGIKWNMNDALLRLVVDTFGPPNVQRRRTTRVCLPSRSFIARSHIERPHDHEREGGLIKIDWETREEKAIQARSRAVEATLSDLPQAVLPGTVSKKAASTLGATSISPAGPIYQQEGLVVYPDRFIPMSPSEIEMHACKFLHLLVNCGEALGAYVIKPDGTGPTLAPAQSLRKDDFDQSLSDYEMCVSLLLVYANQHPEQRSS
ncbi:hypothetical protein OF83DRAFT_242114 [Amylostereum chailletii]|nr:hypothetical protein OF83DRAFT_242114 [Amylostereum chailletii]